MVIAGCWATRRCFVSWVLPSGIFVLLVYGALGLTGAGAVVLLVLFVRDVRMKSTW